ncbi:MAG TPA: DUF494 family protein [Candidatus Kapabacteria bacterium]|nr:DUF494 family protein [Candidatus Kapabacteria bacterium]
MFQRIIEIIIYVISELQDKRLDDINFEKLVQLGYSDSEISTAISWIADNHHFNDVVNQSPKLSKNKSSFRIFTPHETEYFTPEAFVDLIHYNLLGILKNEDIENLLDRYAVSGYTKIDSNDIKVFIANVKFDAFNQLNSPIRKILLGNETIN